MLRALLLLVALVLSGCGGSAKVAVVKVDLGTAQESLKQTLDGWKAGKKPEELAKGTPPISVTDLEWSRGTKLVDYQIVNDEEARGQGLVAEVNLKTSGQDGKITEATAKYVVNTNDGGVSIFRVKPKMR